VTAEEKIQELRRDGFVFFRQLYSPELARKAHDELKAWYDRDNQAREREGIRAETWTGPAGTTVKTEPTHLLIDAYGKSPALDRIVDTILTHPVSAAVFHKMVGEHYKFRGYNVRLMTGAFDPGPQSPPHTALPHEWHRDSPGEFGIGIFLTSMPAGGNGGTALLPGSHLYPYCPRWNTLFNLKYTASLRPPVCGMSLFARFNLFNRWLGRRLMKKAQEATGELGDCYFFMNDVWHGRYPNLHGRKGMIVLIGGFPTDFPFPDEVKSPPAQVINALPASIQAGLIPQPKKIDTDTVIHWMLNNRPRAPWFSLFSLARLERRLANVISKWVTVPIAWSSAWVKKIFAPERPPLRITREQRPPKKQEVGVWASAETEDKQPNLV
jgi:hypothetical protein